MARTLDRSRHFGTIWPGGQTHEQDGHVFDNDGNHIGTNPGALKPKGQQQARQAPPTDGPTQTTVGKGAATEETSTVPTAELPIEDIQNWKTLEWPALQALVKKLGGTAKNKAEAETFMAEFLGNEGS